jgi:hypothetical protein
METLTEPAGLKVELWLSFVSMLRSYAAAASLRGEEVRVSSERNAVTVSAPENQVEMDFDPDSGVVNWQRRTARHSSMNGVFSLHPDGVIAIDGTTKDLDHAAIDFIAFVMQKAEGGA